jgi:hypothetical protein
LQALWLYFHSQKWYPKKIIPDLTDFLFGATKKTNPSSDSRTAMAASTDAKWTRNCDAAQILKSMLENGEVAQGDLPKESHYVT